jgi:hypothetical protein
VWWSDWLATLRLPGGQRKLVARSALTLRALCHSARRLPAGASMQLWLSSDGGPFSTVVSRSRDEL